ncbi:hypothetical protein BBP40_004343 [Aspergillus hancockii]|nr:hypothetical protein BBP40_004343 [Aspergillus hancockii]
MLIDKLLQRSNIRRSEVVVPDEEGYTAPMHQRFRGNGLVDLGYARSRVMTHYRSLLQDGFVADHNRLAISKVKKRLGRVFILQPKKGPEDLITEHDQIMLFGDVDDIALHCCEQVRSSWVVGAI